MILEWTVLPRKFVVYLPVAAGSAGVSSFIKYALSLEGIDGATADETSRGYWKNAAGQVVEDAITKVTFWWAPCERWIAINRSLLAEYVLREFGQEAVACEAGNSFFIGRKPSPEVTNDGR